MEKESFQAFCQQLADCFMSGDHMELARFYMYPLALYHGETVRVEAGPGETAKAVSLRRARALEAGARRIAVDVLEMTAPAEDRIQARASWRYLNASGNPVDVTVLTYFCTRGPDGIYRIGMIQFESLAFPGRSPMPVPGYGPH